MGTGGGAMRLGHAPRWNRDQGVYVWAPYAAAWTIIMLNKPYQSEERKTKNSASVPGHPITRSLASAPCNHTDAHLWSEPLSLACDCDTLLYFTGDRDLVDWIQESSASVKQASWCVSDWCNSQHSSMCEI